MWGNLTCGFQLFEPPSKNPDRLVFNIGAEQRRQPAAGPIIELFADRSLDRLISLHEGEKSEVFLGSRIDKNIVIGVRSGLISCMRSKQVKRRHAEGLEGRLGFFQLGYDFIAAHASIYSGEAVFSTARVAKSPNGSKVTFAQIPRLQPHRLHTAAHTGPLQARYFGEPAEGLNNFWPFT
jgi:hypothetical protein